MNEPKKEQEEKTKDKSEKKDEFLPDYLRKPLFDSEKTESIPKTPTSFQQPETTQQPTSQFQEIPQPMTQPKQIESLPQFEPQSQQIDQKFQHAPQPQQTKPLPQPEQKQTEPIFESEQQPKKMEHIPQPTIQIQHIEPSPEPQKIEPIPQPTPTTQQTQTLPQTPPPQIPPPQQPQKNKAIKLQIDFKSLITLDKILIIISIGLLLMFVGATITDCAHSSKINCVGIVILNIGVLFVGGILLLSGILFEKLQANIRMGLILGGSFIVGYGFNNLPC